MPVTTTRAALRSPIGSENNDVVTDMAHLAQDADDAFAMLGQGLIGSRPTASKVRRMYYATDDRGGKLHYDDGTTWHEIGPAPVTGPQTGYTGFIVSAASAALADVTLGIRAKASQSGDILDVQDSAGTTHHVRVAITGNLITKQAIQARPSTGGTSLDATDGTNSSLRISHPSSGILRMDVDAGNTVQNSVANSAISTLSSAGALATIGTASFFGANALGASGTRLRVGSEGDASNAYVSAEGSGINVGLILRGKGGSGSIVLQPTSGTTVLTVAPALITTTTPLTVGGKVTITTGGIDVAGSASGYSDELRLTSAPGGGSHAITTNDTGSPYIGFHHLGSSNTGFWSWSNGTSAANNQMLLSGVGLLTTLGGVTTSGSPSGYVSVGEYRSTATGGVALTTSAGSTPDMGFHHRNTSNAGTWSWANGSAAASTRMSLSGVGLLTAVGGVDSTGSPSGAYNSEIRLNATPGGGTHSLSTNDTSTTTMLFAHRGASNAGKWRWMNGTSGGTQRMQLSQVGDLTINGTLTMDGTVISTTGSSVAFNAPGFTLMQLISSGSISSGVSAIGYLMYKSQTNVLSSSAVYVGPAGSGPGGSGQALYVT